MDSIRMYDIVTSNGLYLNSDKLRKYIDQKVEITIVPVNKPKTKREKMLEFSGIFDDDTAKEMLDAVAECKSIDLEEWNEIST